MAKAVGMVLCDAFVSDACALSATIKEEKINGHPKVPIRTLVAFRLAVATLIRGGHRPDKSIKKTPAD